MKILIAVGDQQVSDRLFALLKDRQTTGNFVLYRARTADETHGIFVDSHPDLVMVGTTIDGRSSADICRKIREQEGKRHTGIIYLAENEENEDTLSVRCLEAGADDFLKSSCHADELIARVFAVLRLKTMTDELRSANHRLQMLSLTDDLTGLANMRNFHQRFNGMLESCRDGVFGLAVIMLDLDHFKSVNDTANHLVGSHVIREVGRLLNRREIVGREDVAARYGGDEFVIARAVSSRQEAEEVAEIIRKSVEATLFTKDGVEIRITSSIGVAIVEPGFLGKGEYLIKAADLMLYKSKELGRNRVSSVAIGREPAGDLLVGNPTKAATKLMRFEVGQLLAKVS
jgi:diguanylate cyclase (GGDEF)-like protein